jgi:hypothetical protein
MAPTRARPKGQIVKKTLKHGLRRTNTEVRYRYLCKVRRGRYAWKAYAVELAGNTQKNGVGVAPL